MNQPRLFRFISGATFAILMAGCAMFQRGGQPPLVGTWTNVTGTVWTIKSDGTFDVDLNRNGKRDAWGTYSATADTITIIGTGGVMPKGCNGKGVYHFKRDGDSLRFTLVSDACKLRKKNVLLPWRKK